LKRSTKALTHGNVRPTIPCNRLQRAARELTTSSASPAVSRPSTAKDGLEAVSIALAADRSLSRPFDRSVLW